MSTLPILQRVYLYAHLLNQDLRLISPPTQSAATDVQDAYRKLDDELGALHANLPHVQLRAVSESLSANELPSDGKRGRDIARSPTLESDEEPASGRRSHGLAMQIKNEDSDVELVIVERLAKKRRLQGSKAAIEQDNDGDVSVANTTSASKAEIVEKRVICVVKDMAQDALTPADLYNMIVLEDTSKRVAREDAALARFVRGVEAGSRADWEAALKSIACKDAGNSAAADWIASCDAIDKLADPAMRLVRRHQTLDTMAGDAAGAAYIYRAMQTVEALKFASEWNTLKGPGCLTVKNRFHVRAFQEMLPYAAAYTAENSAGDSARPQVRKEHKAAFYQWRKRQEITVTARNRLFALYNAFGCMVLLDPFWRIGTVGYSWSRSLNPVIERVHAELCGDDMDASAILRVSHESAYAALRQVFAVLHSQEVADKIADFVRDNPPDFVLQWSGSKC